MRKLLQVLTIVLLVLSAGALTLGIMLFGKRELLKSRTQSLEKAIVELSALIETPTDPEQKPASFAERDVAEVSDKVIPEPERASFWKDYPLYLEDADKPVATIRREDLMHYYKVDPISGKPMKDPATGIMITTGDGTMDATIKKVLAAAQYELDRLNQTRHQLGRVREELVNTIQALNEGKQRLRQSLSQNTDQKNTIAGLEDDKRQLESSVASLEEEKTTLQDDVAAKEKLLQDKEEEIKLRDETITSQRQQIADLKKGSGPGGTGMATAGIIKMEAGQKGRVVSVNSDWGYVVLQLDDVALAEIDTMREAMTKANTPGFPSVELFLKRGDTYVSKIKLVQIKRDQKLAVADVLVDWQQAAVKAGDIAFF
ncbi:MAG: hypothetical protein K8T26_09945 [Lentisphaerae bacterium]|nr:hypothetical protein [Lentisphaerota bacterium]